MEMAEPAVALLTMRMRGRIQAATTANVTETAPKADHTYEIEWRKFKAFVDAERDGQGNRLPQGDKYLTRNAVDLYFSTVIAHRTTVMPESARRVVSSLQFLPRTRSSLTVMKSLLLIAILSLVLLGLRSNATLSTLPHKKSLNRMLICQPMFSMMRSMSECSKKFLPTPTAPRIGKTWLFHGRCALRAMSEMTLPESSCTAT
jgi:hypothetical protein